VAAELSAFAEVSEFSFQSGSIQAVGKVESFTITLFDSAAELRSIYQQITLLDIVQELVGLSENFTQA